jgi:hypothetical protein
MNLVKGNFTVIGVCDMDSIQDFNSMSYELKSHYGTKNVWFDRDYTNRKIISHR